jgi:hypothetical protein
MTHGIQQKKKNGNNERMNDFANFVRFLLFEFFPVTKFATAQNKTYSIMKN